MAQKMTWDADGDRKLLLSIIKNGSVTLDYNAVASDLGCTPKAVRVRFGRLKEMSGVTGDTAKGNKRDASDTNGDEEDGGKKKRMKASSKKGASKKEADAQDGAKEDDQDSADAIKAEDAGDSD
ncbi:Hypothetical protein D9617_13g101000 [Elsinoe fawcettii]|nr:Hypothetical protein D9617_13g101000 [Elsinoe fawcettii]